MQEWRKQTIYFGEMTFSCAMAVVLLTAASPLHADYSAALFAGGFVAWTLAEYAVHRFVLHKLAPKEHGLHHAHPDEAVTRIFWQIWICFGLVGLLAGGAFLSGALVAYSWYLIVADVDPVFALIQAHNKGPASDNGRDCRTAPA